MASFIFLIVGSFGIVSTIMLLRKVPKADSSNHIHALILSMGLGLTWMIAPLSSIFYSAQHLDTKFVVFWVGHSFFVMVLLYIFDRTYLRSKK